MVLITVCRTLFYQFFLLFVGLSIGFIINAEWIGGRSLVVHRSFSNIFFPVKYDEHMERWVKGWGSYRIYAQKDYPKDFEIIDECVYANEEYYWCRFKYRGKDGKIKFEEQATRVRWKTWEYYYEPDSIIDTTDKMREKIQRDSESLEKRRLEIEEAKKKEQRILKEES